MATTIREHLFKVLVIGEFGVGKTSVIKRYVDGSFSPNYKLTIGVDFALKTIEWDEQTKVNLQLWDIAGHERFGHMTRVYYKYAIAAILVFDLSRPATFDSIPKWLNDVNTKVMLQNEEPVPVILLANKRDVEDAVIDSDHLDTFCRENNICAWFDTSAKDGTNIDKAMRYLIDKILTLPADVPVETDSSHIILPNKSRPKLRDQDFDDVDHTSYGESFEREMPQQKGCCG